MALWHLVRDVASVVVCNQGRAVTESRMWRVSSRSQRTGRASLLPTPHQTAHFAPHELHRNRQRTSLIEYGQIVPSSSMRCVDHDTTPRRKSSNRVLSPRLCHRLSLVVTEWHRLALPGVAALREGIGRRTEYGSLHALNMRERYIGGVLSRAGFWRRSAMVR